MARQRNKLAGKAALAASATLLAVALPSSVFAVGMLSDDTAPDGAASHIAFTPALADPLVAEMIAEQSGSKARMIRFTPAGSSIAGNDRAVTVAMRVDQETANALAGRSDIASGAAGERVLGGLQVSPTRYNLGLARGYANFAQPAARAPQLSSALSNADIPDIAEFAPRSSQRDEPSRFAARVEMEEGALVAGRPTDARGSIGDQLLDLGGSYRLTRNLDITAGVRYEQDRDLVPLPDVEQQDSQAVYIGTQLRF